MKERNRIKNLEDQTHLQDADEQRDISEKNHLTGEKRNDKGIAIRKTFRNDDEYH